MAIETFKSFKDYVLLLLMSVLIKLAWDIRTEVSQLHDDSIVKTIDIQVIKQNIVSVDQTSKEKNREQDRRLDKFEAILNDNNLQQKKRTEINY
jgi:hypothetical protein